MATQLTFDLQNATPDWQIYWRLRMEEPESKLSEQHRATIREQLPPAILDMVITDEVKERVEKMAKEQDEEIKQRFSKNLFRKHIYEKSPTIDSSPDKEEE